MPGCVTRSYDRTISARFHSTAEAIGNSHQQKPSAKTRPCAVFSWIAGTDRAAKLAKVNLDRGFA
jgi:hypothetical protein